MAGRHIPGSRQPPRSLLLPNHLKPVPPPLLAARHREIQELLLDRDEMITIHTNLKKELASLDEDLRKLSAIAREIRLERDAKVNEIFEKSVKLEAEIGAIEDLNLEHKQVISDVQKLTESKVELSAQFKAIEAELCKVKSDASHLAVVQGDVESMKQELQKGRAAVEFEKKTRIANLEMSEAMEKKKSAMQYEIEMLRAELSNAEKRARAAAAAASNPSDPNTSTRVLEKEIERKTLFHDPGYMGNYGSHNIPYGGGPYSVQYFMHQGQISGDVPTPALYGHPGGSHGPLDTQQSHAPIG